jgi:predicted nucleic-acid-binding Zn-ribbon protein
MDPKPMRCKKCGSTRWLQKELKKTGMSIIDGEVIFSENEDTETEKTLSCYDCCSPMPEEDVRELPLDSAFPEPLLVGAN